MGHRLIVCNYIGIKHTQCPFVDEWDSRQASKQYNLINFHTNDLVKRFSVYSWWRAVVLWIKRSSGARSWDDRRWSWRAMRVCRVIVVVRWSRSSEMGRQWRTTIHGDTTKTTTTTTTHRSEALVKWAAYPKRIDRLFAAFALQLWRNSFAEKLISYNNIYASARID